jgi:hypothetical protein
VDSSGFGSDSEPALTQRQFMAKVREEMKANPQTAFAITEYGQFQCFVGVYRWTGKGRGKYDKELRDDRVGWTP